MEMVGGESLVLRCDGVWAPWLIDASQIGRLTGGKPPLEPAMTSTSFQHVVVDSNVADLKYFGRRWAKTPTFRLLRPQKGKLAHYISEQQ